MTTSHSCTSTDTRSQTTVVAHTGTSNWLLLALLFLWIMPGLIGHDPWKADEPYSFGLVSHMLTTGDWIVPTLAGEPFMEKPPLFYLTAAITAKLFSPILQLHDGARLASGLYILLVLIFVGLTADELLGKGQRLIAALILAGCLGIQENGHKLITDTALLAGCAIALYGLALSRRRSLPGGFWLGTGVGIGFMSKGMIAPGLIGPITILLPLFCSAWRHRGYGYALLVAIAAALPWLTVWPLALYLHRPELFREWFWVQNVGRYLGHHHLGPKNEPFFYVKTLLWYAWPALPLSLYALWKERSFWKSASPLRLPLLAFVLMFSILSAASDARSLYALPMLLPLAVLASAGVAVIPLRIGRLLNLIFAVLFALIAGVLWCGWLLMLRGYSLAAIGKLLERFTVTPGFSMLHFVIALFYTLGWVWLTARRPTATSMRPLINWTAGVTLVLGVFLTLWLPALDMVTSYRAVLTAAGAALPPGTRQLASMGLGESERAMFEYYAGLVTARVEINDANDNKLLLLQTGNKILGQNPGSGWQKFWEGSRPGNKKEAFSLWKKIE